MLLRGLRDLLVITEWSGYCLGIMESCLWRWLDTVRLSGIGPYGMMSEVRISKDTLLYWTSITLALGRRLARY